MTLPVFKTGGRRFIPASVRSTRTRFRQIKLLRSAPDFGARLKLGGYAASLTPRKRLNFKTGVSRVSPGSGRFDSDTLLPFIVNRLGDRLILSNMARASPETAAIGWTWRLLSFDVPLSNRPGES